MQPVADALGALVLDASEVGDGDIPLEWEGEVVGALRLPARQDALRTLVDQVERELGAALADLSRADKQRAVRMLDDRGAFALRKSIEEVADRMGVSRPTVYNYLQARRADEQGA